MPAAPKVFISYSHDSPEHGDRVLDLANRLREDGIDAEIDQYETSPPVGWPAWCERQIKAADFVLLVCTEIYLRRVDGEEAPGIGHGVLWEAHIIRQLLYDAGSVSRKFVPVLFSGGSPEHIPTPVKGAARFIVDDDNEYERLYRLLTAQPRVLKPVLGKRKMLPPKERKSTGAVAADASTPSPPHPGPLPQAGEGDNGDAAGIPRPRAGEGGTRDSGRVRAKEKPMPKERIYIGVDPRELPDFAVFKDVDTPWYPDMVVIPAGRFLMGSPKNEKERSDSEGPQHLVTIGYRFAMGRYAVTVSEYRRFAEATSRDHTGGICVWSGREWKLDASKSWCDPGFKHGPASGRGCELAGCVAFFDWLGQETGKLYRLPSEAEWEYACRAGTATPFSFGETITTSQANYDGNYSYAGGPKGEYRQRTVPVGTLPANPWGLYEMHGNVWEWVEDVWHENFSGAPTDGSAWTHGEGKESSHDRVYRGGSWFYIPRYCRSAYRNSYYPHIRYYYLGFRVARTLD